MLVPLAVVILTVVLIQFLPVALHDFRPSRIFVLPRFTLRASTLFFIALLLRQSVLLRICFSPFLRQFIASRKTALIAANANRLTTLEGFIRDFFGADFSQFKQPLVFGEYTTAHLTFLGRMPPLMYSQGITIRCYEITMRAFSHQRAPQYPL